MIEISIHVLNDAVFIEERVLLFQFWVITTATAAAYVSASASARFIESNLRRKVKRMKVLRIGERRRMKP